MREFEKFVDLIEKNGRQLCSHDKEFYESLSGKVETSTGSWVLRGRHKGSCELVKQDEGRELSVWLGRNSLILTEDKGKDGDAVVTSWYTILRVGEERWSVLDWKHEMTSGSIRSRMGLDELNGELGALNVGIKELLGIEAGL